MCLHWRNWVRFFHVQYKKRRVLLAERKRLVTHRVTCLLHFKRECTSFVCARKCVCVLCRAHKKECARECSQRLFSRWILLLCGNAHACGHCAISRSVSKASVSYLCVVWRYLHSISSYPYGDMLHSFCKEPSSLGLQYPTFSSVWRLTRAFYLFKAGGIRIGKNNAFFM